MPKPAALLALALCACAAQRVHVPPADPALPFSNAVVTGDTIWVAGHLGLDPATGRAPDDPAREARLVLEGFLRSLAAAGGAPEDLVQVTVFCSDVSLYDTFNAAYRELVPAPFPARAFVGSGPLLRGCRFEVTGVAVAH